MVSPLVVPGHDLVIGASVDGTMRAFNAVGQTRWSVHLGASCFASLSCHMPVFQRQNQVDADITKSMHVLVATHIGDLHCLRFVQDSTIHTQNAPPVAEDTLKKI